MDNYQKFIYKSRYARWIDAEKRREEWEETVTRYMDFMFSYVAEKHGYTPPKSLYKFLWDSIYEFKALPSMRALMTAGPALARCNVAGYNCAYVPINHIRCFDEILYILMCGTGIGVSVERQYISQLAEVNEHFENSDTVIVVADTKSGWARALRELLSMLWQGQIPSWDVSRLRPKGARLKTFGGRSSGPEPLIDLFNFTVNMFRNAAGRKLTSQECHDLVCMIGDVVVSGGVRRSALISLSNLSDERMRLAKSGDWHYTTPYRQLANNSVAYTEKPGPGIFMKEWLALYDSKSGERGIFNRVAARNKVISIGRRDPDYEWGCNPCSEIILRPFQFCNLTEVVVRSGDTLEDLIDKVYAATVLGTLQATLTDFKYLRRIWQTNTEEERLLGVSLTGVMDHHILSTDTDEARRWLTAMKAEAIRVNKSFSKNIGIPQSAAITCNKPSGTVSQLVNSSSGIHSRFSHYYIRRVMCDITDPMTRFMMDVGIPHEPSKSKPDRVMVFSFPVKTPDTAIFDNSRTAIDQLKLWKMYQDYWCEHKPSATIVVKEHEWLEVGAWVYSNFNEISGLSFLPCSDHVYQQAPYEEITEDRYVSLIENHPKDIDWSRLTEYETDDNTASSQTLACTGSVCEVVNIGDV